MGEKGSSCPLVASLAKNIGLCFLHAKKYDDAITYIDQSIQVSKYLLSTGFEKTCDIAQLFGLMGYCYGNLGKFSSAIESYEKSLDFYLVFHDSSMNHKDFVSPLLNLAYYRMKTHNNKKAVVLNKKCLGILKNMMTQDATNEQRKANVLNNLANCYFNLGNYSEAMEIVQESMMVMENCEVKNYPVSAESLNILGKCHRNIKNFSVSLEYHDKCISNVQGKS